jgi:hypothetical protein
MQCYQSIRFIYIHRMLHSRRVENTFFFLVELRFELRVLCWQSRYSSVLASPSVHFGLVILEMGSPKLFAWAGLELCFS